ncbi:unnamed protein product, partial [Ixodes persulcatus]
RFLDGQRRAVPRSDAIDGASRAEGRQRKGPPTTAVNTSPGSGPRPGSAGQWAAASSVSRSFAISGRETVPTADRRPLDGARRSSSRRHPSLTLLAPSARL